jgi:hypothetical protein
MVLQNKKLLKKTVIGLFKENCTEGRKYSKLSSCLVKKEESTTRLSLD